MLDRSIDMVDAASDTEDSDSLIDTLPDLTCHTAPDQHNQARVRLFTSRFSLYRFVGLWRPCACIALGLSVRPRTVTVHINGSLICYLLSSRLCHRILHHVTPAGRTDNRCPPVMAVESIRVAPLPHSLRSGRRRGVISPMSLSRGISAP